jgi:hypothetical protein
MMASSLAALRGRGGGALGSDRLSICGGRFIQQQDMLRLPGRHAWNPGECGHTRCG